MLCLQVGESFINVSAPGWQYYKGLFSVVKPFTGPGTPWGRGWSINLRIQSSVAWFLLLCSSEEGKLRSPIAGAPISSESLTTWVGPREMICSGVKFMEKKFFAQITGLRQD